MWQYFGCQRTARAKHVSKLVLTCATGAEWGRVRSVFYLASFLKIAGSGVCPRDCFLSFERLLSMAYDICGSTLGGTKGPPALSKLVSTCGLGAEAYGCSGRRGGQSGTGGARC
jgi:hypothetical protein